MVKGLVAETCLLSLPLSRFSPRECQGTLGNAMEQTAPHCLGEVTPALSQLLGQLGVTVLVPALG